MHRKCHLTAVILVVILQTLPTPADDSIINIGNRRELFVDDHLIHSKTGEIALKLHHPQAREVALNFDRPWEGNTSGYPTVMFDGQVYRMIYRGHRMIWESGKLLMANSPVVCYAESQDGINWVRPNLNIVKWQGKDRDKLSTPTSNNIVWGGSPYSGTFVPFEDKNPACQAQQRFKAVGGNHKVGLHLFTSSDAIHWTKSDHAIFHEGALDSMNTLFWDASRERYTLYFRTVRNSLRSIDMVHSKNLKTWSNPKPLTYGNSPPQQMYTNGIAPYYRAPHIMLGFPTRYTARSLTSRLSSLPPVTLRKELGDAYARVASDLSDGLFMSTRNGVVFDRWDEAFIRPHRETSNAPSHWMYGDNYQGYGLFPTIDENGLEETSFLVSHGYWQEYKSYIQRYSIRPDGFVSLNAKYSGGEVITKQLLFAGTKLELNYATSAAGSVRVELQDNNGNILSGYSLEDCTELTGNKISQTVSWSGEDLGRHSGTPIRIRFALKDADLYSFRFFQ